MAQKDVPHTFEDEVFFSLRRQRTVAAWLAVLGMLVGLTSVVALALLLPLKEVQPYIVMVDRATGDSELIVSTTRHTLSEEEAVRQAELVQYVTDRETYDPTDNRTRIPLIELTSEGQARTSLVALWSRGAENYPPDTYGPDARITVRVRAVALLDDTSAQVRFTKRLEKPGTDPVVRDFIATIGFEFRAGTQRRLEQVWKNPHDFVVTSYRIDAETLGPRATEGQ